MLTEEQLVIVVYLAEKRIQENKITPYLIEVVENAIKSSMGKTPMRYKLLKIWQEIA